MAFTKHGHYIPDTTYEGVGEDPIVDCGGPDECDDCYDDAVIFHEEVANAQKRLRRGEQPNGSSGRSIRDTGKDRPGTSRWTRYTN